MTKRMMLGLVLLAALIFGLGACGGGGGGGGESYDPGPPGGGDDTTVDIPTLLSGNVVDWYVRDATVFAYDRPEMLDPIGTGTTDVSGNFSFSVLNSVIPETVYLKSVGGFDNQTGAPAATMMFKGSRNLETFHITPMTQMLWKYDQYYDNAASVLADYLDLPQVDLLYADPFADGSLSAVQSAHYAALNSGTHGSTLTAGQYTAVLLFLEEQDLGHSSAAPDYGYQTIADLEATNIFEIQITLDSDQRLSGTMEGQPVTGYVSGSSFALTIETADLPLSWTQFSGTIGLLGHSAGNYTNFSAGASSTTKGVFVAAFIPNADGEAALYEAGYQAEIINLMSGQQNLMYRDLFGLEKDADSVFLTTSNVTFEDTFSAEIHTVEEPPFAAEEARFLRTSSDLPTGIAISRFEMTDGDPSFPIQTFLIQTAGHRRGIYLSTSDVPALTTNAENIGEIYTSQRNSLSPVPVADQYTYQAARAHLNILGSPRDPSFILSSQTNVTVPELTSRFGQAGAPDSVPPDYIQVNGSAVAFKSQNCAAGCALLSQSHYVVTSELFESGALQGEIIYGGSYNLPTADGLLTIDMKQTPLPYVGLLLRQQQTIPTFDGQLQFLGRDLYYADPTNYGVAETVSIGAIDILGNEAVFMVNGLDVGELSVTNYSGVYHIHGIIQTDDGSEYIDLYWPVGGTKAVYTRSTAAVNGTVQSIGEAFLTIGHSGILAPPPSQIVLCPDGSDSSISGCGI